jgi:ureidoglycolate lyase
VTDYLHSLADRMILIKEMVIARPTANLDCIVCFGHLTGKIDVVSLLNPIPINSTNFASFGWLASGENLNTGQNRLINDGTSLRLDDCGELSLTAQGGQACLALFRAQARDLTLPCITLERHRLGTQTFVPMGGVRYVMLVAHGDTEPDIATLSAFVVEGHQAVTLRANIWHHGLIALDAGDFIVIERSSKVVDCEFASLRLPVYLSVSPD